MTTNRVLLIDDDATFRFAMKKALQRFGYTVEEAASGEKALEMMKSDAPAVALLDLRMGGMGGLDVLRRCTRSPTRFIVLTGHGTVRLAVDAMRLGAFSFLEKPVDADELKPLVDQALRAPRGDGVGGGLAEPVLVGGSNAMQAVGDWIDRVAPSDETVCVLGETGTGKEVVARLVHARSQRSRGPFVAMNAACVSKELFESELFGHKRGSFTGATKDHPGLFREAHGGTLFIDELTELPASAQAKLLRVLETRQVRAIGATSEEEVDVRIVAATNRDLRGEVDAGRFREDLYFRLQVVPITLPPLRDRLDDVEELSTFLLQDMGRAHLRLAPDAISALRAYDWPGNVRELLNVLRRASLFCETDTIDGELATQMISASVFGRAGAEVMREERASVTNLADLERSHIERVLEEQGGNVTRAATALGIDRRTLQRKMRAWDPEPKT